MRIHDVSFALLAALTAACVNSEPADDPGAVDNPDELIGTTDQDLAPDETEVLLPVTEEAAQPDTYHRLMSTPYNLKIFREGCYDPEHNLEWDCPNNEDGAHAHFINKRKAADDIEVADNHGYYWGECVSLVKAASHNNVVTADWRPGANVFANLASGTAIATFPGGHYYGHAAIFLSYVRNASGTVIGIRIADQNWGAPLVKRHVLYKSGSGVADADNFRAILVP